MSSVFPALQDKLLTRLLISAVLLLVIAVVASALREAPGQTQPELPSLSIGGGSAPSQPAAQ